MEYKEKLELAASDYAITHYEQGKAYASLKVHKMLVDAFSAGANGLKYNEALDRAKEELTKDNTYETNQAIERIFPELKSESEEEKEIEKYCRIYYNCNYPDQIQNGKCSPVMPHIIEAARHFAKWGAEHLKK